MSSQMYRNSKKRFFGFLTVFLLAFVVCSVAMANSYAKYVQQLDGNSSQGNVAVFYFGTSAESDTVQISCEKTMTYSDTDYYYGEYSFSVTNDHSGTVCDVSLQYDVYIYLPTGTPDYIRIFTENGGNVTAPLSLQNNEGYYFSALATLPAGTSTTNNHTLRFAIPKNKMIYNANTEEGGVFSLSGFTVTVYALQSSPAVTPSV